MHSQKRFVAAVAVAAGLTSAGTAHAALYQIMPIGLTDAEHTRSDGYRYSAWGSHNAAGHVAGTAQRYSGADFMGQSVWLYNGATTINVGLTGAEHTRSNGYRYSNFRSLNAAGHVAGAAERYNGTTALGASAWLYNGSETLNIGLTGSEHTRNDGWKSSDVQHLNAAGQAAGWAERYNGATQIGRSAWLFNGSSTVNIGPTDVEHTRNDGFQNASVHGLSAAGHVAGLADRYNGSSLWSGQTAWLYNGSTTINVGLIDAEHTRSGWFREAGNVRLNDAGHVAGTSRRYSLGNDRGVSVWLHKDGSTRNVGLVDAEHTRSDGLRASGLVSLNANGQVAGNANRYNGTAGQLGQSAWVYNGTATVNVGPVDVEHTRSDGLRYSMLQHFNDAGQAAGYAYRYNGTATSLGQSAWVYDGSATVKVGLSGGEHTRADGYQDSRVTALNAAGQAAGASTRYSGTTNLGNSAWVYDGEITADVSLSDLAHTRNDGYRDSTVSFLNAAGQAAGLAIRYNGGAASLGRSAWFYDPTLEQTFSLDLSLKSDGYGFSQINYLGDDGLAVGFYTLFGENDVALGTRAFAFTLADGAFDLGGVVEGGLDAAGWTVLADAIRTNGLGQIIGNGLLAGMSSGQMAYVLTPSAVPVPGAVWLLGSGLVGLIGVARRRKAA